MTSLIDAIDGIGRHLQLDASGHVVAAQADRIAAALAPVGDHPVSAEIKRCVTTGSFAENRLLACSDYGGERGLIAGVVSTPYIKDAEDQRIVCLQAFAYADHPAQTAMRRHHPAPLVRPVTLRRATGHLATRLRYVAFFPDALLGEVPDDYRFSIYFPEKFATVMQTQVLPVINRLWVPEAFAMLRSMSRDDLVRAAAIWVHLHEYHHNSAALPIDAFPVIKNTRLAGAFEEMRVDLRGMCLDLCPAVGEGVAQQVFEFILAFRLVYYATCFTPETDFDAVTSVALANTLLAREEIGQDTAGRFRFLRGETGLRAALQDVLDQMTAMEEAVAQSVRAQGGGGAAERAARPVFETAMSLMCGARSVRQITRGAFHLRHVDAGAALQAA